MRCFALFISMTYSLVGAGGHHAPPGNKLFVGATRWQKLCRKRICLLTGSKNVPRMFYMQISTAIMRKSFFRHISANIPLRYSNEVSIPIFWGSRIQTRLFSKQSNAFLRSNAKIGYFFHIYSNRTSQKMDFEVTIS